MKFVKNIIFMFKYSWKISKKSFFAAAIEIVLQSVAPFIYLVFPSLIINELTKTENRDTVWQTIGLFAGAVIVLYAFKLITRVFVSTANQKADVKNGMHYAELFTVMPYEKLEDEKIRNTSQTVSANVRANSFILSVTGLLSSAIKLVGFSYIILMLEPVVLIFMFLFIIGVYFINKKLSKNTYEYQPTLANHTRLFDYLFDTMTNFDYAKEIRINTAGQFLLGKFNETLFKYKGDNGKYLDKQLWLHIISDAASFVQSLLSYGYVAYCAITGMITVGEFNLYIGAIYNLSGAFNDMISKCIELKYISKYVDDYHDFTEQAMIRKTDGEASCLPNEDDRYPMIEFDHVSFAYPHTEKPVLNNISVKIQKGEKLSVVGLNGAGKTTFIKLICRYYKPTQGVIRYYGVDISTIEKEAYYKKIAAVFQDFKVFSFSFLDNIVLNQPLDEDKLNRSVENTGLVSKIQTLPHGMKTSLFKDFDEEGIELSGGEGQKLVMARAFYKDADLVILDEPTAALDAFAENEIYRKFNVMTLQKTAIFISHRLASTRFCDKIAVFENGRIVEYGNHDSLMEKKGLYAEMFEKQAAYYKPTESSL